MKDDQRIALTKRLLREGLLRLLSKTDLNKISVTQLCIESGINRATFYRHYEEPRDILNDIKYEIFQEVSAFAEKAASKGDTRKWLELACCYFYEHSDTCLDVCEIHIGDNVMIGPNVTLATPMHPLLPEERNIRKREDGSFYNLEYAKPITIKDNCWLASNVVVCGGVTIGEGCVIGAGSVVTKDIPPYSLAVGNPCRVIRKITEKDHMPDGIEKN